MLRILMKIPEKVEVQDSGGVYTTITLNGAYGVISAGGNGNNGDILFYDADGKERMKIGAEEVLISGHGTAGNKVFQLSDTVGGGTWLVVGTDKITLDGTRGDIFVDDEAGRSLTLRGKGFDGKTATMLIGSNAATAPKAGYIGLMNDSGKDFIKLDGSLGIIVLRDQEGKLAFSVDSQTGDFAGLWIGGSADPLEGPKAGKVFLRDTNGNDSIVLDGSAGDIFLNNSDCAEEFYISDLQNAEPGTVMVLEQEGMLRQSSVEYDKKVAGVISGAGDCKPGIVLDKKPLKSNRKPVALMGKVYCKVDADTTSIEVGDLLTTSPTPGHAMKAADQYRAFGAVIGKALQSIKSGKGLIPILIALQ